MRVLQIGKFYPPHRGGMESHLQTLCEELSKFVDISAIVANTTLQTKCEQLNGIRVTRVGRISQTAGASICPGMGKAIRESVADIVHIHLPNPTALLAFRLSGHAGLLVLTYHSDTLRQKLLTPLFNPVLNYFMRRSAAVIASSPNLIEHSLVLSKWRERCHVIPFGIAADQFENADPKAVEEITRRFGPRFVLAVGRLVYYKGFEYLVEAMRDVNANLVIVGQGPLKQALLECATRLGVADRVYILENVHDVIPFYHAANVFALPSVERTEAFGIVQLEAMTAATPVVNTYVKSGVPFVSLNGVTGITIPPRDSLSLAAALNMLIEDPIRAVALGAAARERVRTEFSLDGMVKQTLSLYEKVCSGHSANALQDMGTSWL